MAKYTTSLYSYKVYLNKKHIDTIFYRTKDDPEEVKRSLVEQDGYDANIKVYLEE